jgi:hypothetical protein
MKKTAFFFIALLIEAAYMQTLPPLMLDNTKIVNVTGNAAVNKWWSDSYSVGDQCYCSSKFDTSVGSVLVMTPYGTKTVKEACALIGPGPGFTNRPRYNDIQCGNGPPNSNGDEVTCPGRTEYGIEGCKYIGPKWKFNISTPVSQPNPVPIPVPQPNPVPVTQPISGPVAVPAPLPVPATVPAPLPVPATVPQPNPVPAPVPQPNPVPVPILVLPPLMLDNTKIVIVTGDIGVNKWWSDSYSVGDRCYCASTKNDTDASYVQVETPYGIMTVKEVCALIGPGPGFTDRPRYNDIQCGNGPPNSGDEVKCPGRTEYGIDGCKYIGPTWNFNLAIPVPVPPPVLILPLSVPISAPILGKVPLLLDAVKILDLPGLSQAAPGWEDSYSVGDKCYCSSNWDHGIGTKVVTTPFGNMTVQEACGILGPGPGKKGRPVYNDIQCGNGPPNNDWDEDLCPGRSDWLAEGCKYIGPTWKFNTSTPVTVPVTQPISGPVAVPAPLPVSVTIPQPNPVPAPVPQPNPVPVPILVLPPLMLDNTKIVNVTGNAAVTKWWSDSYSVGDQCYCSSKFDTSVGSVLVMTPYGTKTVKEACDLIGPGPGFTNRPRYNDIQCGNGPPNSNGDEVTCPGRTEYGIEGCKYIGPTWKF